MSKHYELFNIHTGQHYDPEMKKVFVKGLRLDSELQLISTDRKSRMLEMTQSISEYIDKSQPDMIIVYGDTDTTLAAAHAAAEKKIPLCHIEAGLRSHNLEMPEEINRIETDRLSQLLLCPSQEAVDQLRNEGIVKGVFEVGDIMKDAIQVSKKMVGSLVDYNYYYATLHRPYNVDEEARLRYVLGALNNLKKRVILPLHPRTKENMKIFKILKIEFPRIEFIPPQSYISNLKFMIGSQAILTDSGGLQKEAYWINKKCVTLRSETEWKETLHDGCNTLLFDDLRGLQDIINEPGGPWNPKLYGDGQATKKIKDIVDEYFKVA